MLIIIERIVLIKGARHEKENNTDDKRCSNTDYDYASFYRDSIF